MEVKQIDEVQKHFLELKEETTKLMDELKTKCDLIKTQNKKRHDVFKNRLIEKINSELKENIKDMNTKDLNKLICETKFRLSGDYVFLDEQADLEKEDSYMHLDNVEKFLDSYFGKTPLRVTSQKIMEKVDCCDYRHCVCYYNNGQKDAYCHVTFSFFIRDT